MTISVTIQTGTGAVTALAAAAAMTYIITEGKIDAAAGEAAGEINIASCSNRLCTQ